MKLVNFAAPYDHMWPVKIPVRCHAQESTYVTEMIREKKKRSRKPPGGMWGS